MSSLDEDQEHEREPQGVVPDREKLEGHHEPVLPPHLRRYPSPVVVVLRLLRRVLGTLLVARVPSGVRAAGHGDEDTRPTRPEAEAESGPEPESSET